MEIFYEKEELNENGECFEHPGKKLDAVEEENLRTAFEQQKIAVENVSREFNSATRGLEQFDREVKRLLDSKKKK